MRNEDLFECIGKLDDDILESSDYKKDVSWMKWIGVAACVAILAGVGMLTGKLSNLNIPFMVADSGKKEKQDETKTQNSTQSQQETQETDEKVVNEPFISIASLFENRIEGLEGCSTRTIPIGEYEGVYTSINGIDETILKESRGKKIAYIGVEEYYRISGHEDIQYIIMEGAYGYNLLLFEYFKSDEYPYSDILKLVYHVESADDIEKIISEPVNMDNIDGGKAIQEEIGSLTITDRKDIDTIYQILSSRTCQRVEESEDFTPIVDPEEYMKAEQNAARLKRCLSVVLRNGNVINAIGYTAESEMFYENDLVGFGYNRLDSQQEEQVNRILKINR